VQLAKDIDMTTQLVQIRCNALRSKSSYGAYGDFREDQAELLGSTATYWCLKTMGKAGPDDHYVHRSICVEGRSCWENPEREA
jgi:hypothetical protein